MHDFQEQFNTVFCDSVFLVICVKHLCKTLCKTMTIRFKFCDVQNNEGIPDITSSNLSCY